MSHPVLHMLCFQCLSPLVPRREERKSHSSTRDLLKGDRNLWERRADHLTGARGFENEENLRTRSRERLESLRNRRRALEKTLPERRIVERGASPSQGSREYANHENDSRELDQRRV